MVIPYDWFPWGAAARRYLTICVILLNVETVNVWLNRMGPGLSCGGPGFKPPGLPQ